VNPEFYFLLYIFHFYMRRYSYGQDDRISIPGTGKRFLSSPQRPDRLWGPGVKRSGREADHLLPSSAEVKNSGAIISTPPYVFIAWSLIS
jgi:hypothetical protein